MFEELEKINERPEPFSVYTASDLWTHEHTSKQMLSYHLNGEIDISSRNTRFIDQSVDWIVKHFDIKPGVKIADFGCGPGLYTTRLARKNADVTGIDFSKRSIEYAEKDASKEVLSIRYVNQNYLEYQTDEKFDLILMIMCDYCALSPSQRKIMLNKYHDILEPGGSVLLDVYSLTSFNQREETAIYEANLLNGFWSSEKYYGFLNTFKYEKEKVMLDKYTIFEADGSRTVYNWLQYFSPETLQSEFEECGFVIDKFYSNVAGTKLDPDTTEFAVVANKL